MQNVNRALDGDVVAVEILPKQHWLTGQEEVREGGREGGRGGGRERGREGRRIALVTLLLFTHPHALDVSRALTS